jgi:hypothetical protein
MLLSIGWLVATSRLVALAGSFRPLFLLSAHIFAFVVPFYLPISDPGEGGHGAQPCGARVQAPRLPPAAEGEFTDSRVHSLNH